MRTKFKQVSREEFRDFVNSKKDDLIIKDQYDTNPPLLIYGLRKLNATLRYAYIENNEAAFNGKDNKYFVTTTP